MTLMIMPASTVDSHATPLAVDAAVRISDSPLLKIFVTVVTPPVVFVSQYTIPASGLGRLICRMPPSNHRSFPCWAAVKFTAVDAVDSASTSDRGAPCPL
jgi:hypothetical protein